MAILIKSMKMPFTCLTCDFHKCAGGVGDFCSLTKRRQFRFKNRPKGCPLIEVPEPHGRLIDADALRDNSSVIEIDSHDSVIEINSHDGTILAINVEIIDDAPTVIPASEKEE